MSIVPLGTLLHGVWVYLHRMWANGPVPTSVAYSYHVKACILMLQDMVGNVTQQLCAGCLRPLYAVDGHSLPRSTARGPGGKATRTSFDPQGQAMNRGSSSIAGFRANGRSAAASSGGCETATP